MEIKYRLDSIDLTFKINSIITRSGRHCWWIGESCLKWQIAELIDTPQKIDRTLLISKIPLHIVDYATYRFSEIAFSPSFLRLLSNPILSIYLLIYETFIRVALSIAMLRPFCKKLLLRHKALWIITRHILQRKIFFSVIIHIS